MSWHTLETQAPEIAAFGKARLKDKVAYLATIRRDGAPRVHPFTPIIGEGYFFAFMEPNSPKGHDLERDSRFAIHCSVTDTSGESGEFIITGTAKQTRDAGLRALAAKLSSYKPAERYILFEFDIQSAVSTDYKDGEPVRVRWKINE